MLALYPDTANARQVTEVIKLEIGAITLPVAMMAQMLGHPPVAAAVTQFSRDWETAFAGKLSFASSLHARHTHNPYPCQQHAIQPYNSSSHTAG